MPGSYHRCLATCSSLSSRRSETSRCLNLSVEMIPAFPSGQEFREAEIPRGVAICIFEQDVFVATIETGVETCLGACSTMAYIFLLQGHAIVRN
jgi:hypothetical protein